MHWLLHQILLNVSRASSASINHQSLHRLIVHPSRTKNVSSIPSFIYMLFKMFHDESKLDSNKFLKDESQSHSRSNDYKQNQTLKLPKSEEELKNIAQFAASKIALGKIIAVPTDTIYGIACLVQNESAVQDLYNIKGRHPDKPVSVCVAEIDDIYRWGEVTVSRELLEELLPGPVTLCFSRKKELNTEFNPESELVGIRIPDHFFVRELCRRLQSFEGCCSPIALTSANVSGSDSCLETSEFAETLLSRPNSKLEMIFDGGRLGETRLSRLGSTIVDLSTKGYYKIIRQGSAESQTVKILKSHDLLEYSST